MNFAKLSLISVSCIFATACTSITAPIQSETVKMSSATHPVHHTKTASKPKVVTEPEVTATAEAYMINNDGKQVGVAKFRQGPRGILINLTIDGLPAGKHGMHFHTVGDCSPMKTFKSAKGHIMPNKLPHGFFHPDGPHAGNLPNLVVAADGTAEVELYSNLLMLNKGKGKILDADGSALMVHLNEDDHFTQPIGGSGRRIACGIIRAN